MLDLALIFLFILAGIKENLYCFGAILELHGLLRWHFWAVPSFHPGELVVKLRIQLIFFFPCSIFSAQVYSHRAVPAATPGQQQQEQAACDGTGGTADFPHQLQIKATFCVG